MCEEQRFTVAQFLQMPLNKTYCEASGLDEDTTLARLFELFAELRAQKPEASAPANVDMEKVMAKLMARSPAELREQRQYAFVLSLAARANCTMQELDQLRNYGLLPPVGPPADPLGKFD